MKYILIFLLALLCSVGYAQFPVNQYMGSQTTLVTARGGLKADSSLILPQFPDTTTANRSPYIKFYAGNLIRVFNDIYMRNTTATGWILVSSGGGSNNFIDSLKIISDSVYARKYGAFVYQYKTPTTDTTSLSNRINLKLNISDTAAMLAPYSIRINNKIDSLYKIGDSVFARKNGVFVFQYLDISQNILANNGLSFSGDTLQLGGSLIKNTTINADSNEVKIDTVSKFIVTNGLGLNHIYTDSILTRLDVKSSNPVEQNFLKLYLGDRVDYEPQRLSEIELLTTADNRWANLKVNNIEGVYLTANGAGNQSYISLSKDSIAISPNDSIINISKIKTNTDTANYLPLMWNPNVKRLEAYKGGFGNLGVDTTSLSNRINLKLNISDTAGMLSPYFEAIDTVNLRRVTSVGLTMPSAFNVAGSPITDSGTIAVTGAGTASQYVRGDGQLANFPTNGGGGSSVNYYLNGSVNQGTFGGATYYQLSKVPIIGAGTNFTRTNAQGNGYIASFITDANDPALLNIPGGNWNVEFYFNASSGGGNPSFYSEIYKVSATNVFTLVASGSTNPEGITQGTVVDQYFTSIPVPQTTLVATDRIAIRIFVTPSGRNITLHTEDNNLCEVLTTFSTGLNALNGLTNQVQYLAVGTSGTDFGISSATDTHTFNLPTASATNRGALSSADWTTFNGKVSPSDTSNKWITNVFRKTASDSVFFVRGGTNNFAFRDSSGGANIYTTDGTLTGARVVTQGSNSISFTGAGNKVFNGGELVIHDAAQTSFRNQMRLGAISGSATPYISMNTGTGTFSKFFMLQNTPGFIMNAPDASAAAPNNKALTLYANATTYQNDGLTIYDRSATNANSFGIDFASFNQSYNIGITSRISTSLGNDGTTNFPFLRFFTSGSFANGGTSVLSEAMRITHNQNVLIGTTTDVASSILTATSTTKGFLQPRLTTTQMNAISTPATGLSVFNTTDSSEYVYRGTGAGWRRVPTFANMVFTEGAGTNATFAINSASVGGTNNTVFGSNAYQGINSNNTYFGNEAGRNGTPTNGTGVGVRANYGGGNRNVAIGYYALAANSQQYDATMVGNESGLNLTRAWNTTALGGYSARQTSSGANLTFAMNSTFLGYYANPFSNTVYNENVIGSEAFGAGSFTVTLGSNDIRQTFLKGAVAIGKSTSSTRGTIANGAMLEVSSSNRGFLLPKTSSLTNFGRSVNATTRVAGSGYTVGTFDNVYLTGGSGSGATATLTVSGGGNPVSSATINNGGGGYVVGDTLRASNISNYFGSSGTGFYLLVNSVNAPDVGMQAFNTTDSAIYVYRGSGASWQQVANEIFATATLDFPNTLTQTSSDLTITLTGAVDGDAVSLGVPNAAVNANSCYTAWVSAANTVTVRFNNYSSGAIDPAQATFKVTIIK